MTLQERTLEYLKERRNKLLSGEINSIPSPFVRFSNEFIGIEQGKYVVVTGSTKSGKTQFASYVFLYNTLLYAFHNPKQVRVKFFYYALEESPQDIIIRFMSYLLFHLYNIRVSSTDLQSSKNNKPLAKEVIDKMESPEFKEILDFFEEHVEFSQSRNPTGVYLEVSKYMEEHGTTHHRKQKVKDDFEGTKEVDVFDFYEPDDPNEYVFIIWDHASLTQPERGMTLKQSVDKLSEYFVILRNKYKVSPILIQQQAFETESLDAFKANRLRPTAQGLADSKYSSRDCNILLGIFNPFKHELPEYKGYDITKLRDNCRFLEVILNRGGQMGGLIALFFDGATCNWAELPKTNDLQGLEKVYNYVNDLKNPKKATVFFCMADLKQLNLKEKLDELNYNG